MWCIHDKAMTDKLRRRFRGKTTLKLWKAWRSTSDDYLTPLIFANHRVLGAGWVRSNRRTQEPEQDCSDRGRYIQHGIHVYTSRAIARREAAYRWNARVVPVTCYLKDLVAADRESAVFMKVWLAKADFDKAVTGG